MLQPLAIAVPLAADWSGAARVSLIGFAGVFLVLTLLYLCTLAYGAMVRRLSASAGDTKIK